jgi:hypothetical protein
MPLTTPGLKGTRHLAGILWQKDRRPRIALLQSLVGINEDQVRMITGSGPLIYRAPTPHAMPPGAYPLAIRAADMRSQAWGRRPMYLRADRGYKSLVVTCPLCGASRGDDERFWVDCEAPWGGAHHVVSRPCWAHRSAVSASAGAPWPASSCRTGLLAFRPQSCGSGWW